MKEAKERHPSFITALAEINMIPDGKFDPSFTSKLLATIDPNAPVIDSLVLEFYKFKLPARYVDNRLQKTTDIYENLRGEYHELMNKPEGLMIIKKFDARFPGKGVTNIKKLDLVIWKMLAMRKKGEL